jgi:hypothetical protein
VREIWAPNQFELVAALTQYNVNIKDLEAHIAKLQEVLSKRFPGSTVLPGKDRAEIEELLSRDLPIVYFYCHGEQDTSGTYLGVGHGEKITARDFQGWVYDWKKWEHKTVWDVVRPLVFINACHSVEITPDTLVTYLDAFVGTAHAAGVIGTEVQVSQHLAMDVALQFFERFFQGFSAHQALQEIRLDYLSRGNLLGLVYTPYCWTDLRLVYQ